MTERKSSRASKSRTFLNALCFLACCVAGPPFISSGFGESLSKSRCDRDTCDAPSGPAQNPLTAPFIIVQAPLKQDSTGNVGRWRLVRTLGPDGGDVVSIMHVADALKSDSDFAGLMIRCREKSALQIALVVIRPFPPRAHPQVSISAGQTNVRFETSVIPPGSLLSLPNEAEVLARGPWQSATQLNAEIESDGEKIRGIVPLENLSNAIAYLQGNCGTQ